MARTKLIIEEKEKNKILEMYGIQKPILSEQNRPPFNFAPGRIIILESVTPPFNRKQYKIVANNSNNLELQGTRGRFQLLFTDSSKTVMVKPGTNLRYRVLEVKAASTPPPRTRPTATPRVTPTPIPGVLPIEIPSELKTQRIDLFKCPEYVAGEGGDEPAVPSILITKMEEILPKDVDRNMVNKAGRFLKLTTDRPLEQGGKPFVLYFSCYHDGFFTNHGGWASGTNADEFNVIDSKFDLEAGTPIQGCKVKKDLKPLELDRPTFPKIETKPVEIDPNKFKIPTGLKEDTALHGPTRVFSNQLHEFLKSKYCNKTWTKVNSQDDDSETGNV